LNSVGINCSHVEVKTVRDGVWAKPALLGASVDEPNGDATPFDVGFLVDLQLVAGDNPVDRIAVATSAGGWASN
jgi:hypothetical protein